MAILQACMCGANVFVPTHCRMLPVASSALIAASMPLGLALASLAFAGGPGRGAVLPTATFALLLLLAAGTDASACPLLEEARLITCESRYRAAGTVGSVPEGSFSALPSLDPRMLADITSALSQLGLIQKPT